jgi:hypothetical protein
MPRIVTVMLIFHHHKPTNLKNIPAGLQSISLVTELAGLLDFYRLWFVLRPR